MTRFHPCACGVHDCLPGHDECVVCMGVIRPTKRDWQVFWAVVFGIGIATAACVWMTNHISDGLDRAAEKMEGGL